MKYLIFIFLFLNNLFSATISCPEEIIYNSGSGHVGVDYFYYDNEPSQNQGIWVEVYFEAYDNKSAACGGSENSNIQYEFYCDRDVDDGCYNTNLVNSPSDYHFVIPDGSDFKNSVIIVNGIPCIDYDSIGSNARISHTIYDDDSSSQTIYRDSKYASSLITTLSNTYIEDLSDEDAESQRTLCKPPSDEPVSTIDYTPLSN